MKKRFFIISTFLFSTNVLSESPYYHSCEECKEQASQCIDDRGYNNCLKMIGKCNEICRKVYDVNITDQKFIVEQYEEPEEKKSVRKELNDNIEIFGAKDITISVIKIKECGMEKMPGLQIWYTTNLKRGFGLCYNMTTFLAMTMKRDKIKELDLGRNYHYLSYKKDTEITSYLIRKKKKYQLKLTLRVPDQEKLITRFFDFPFDILPYEKRIPKVQQILKSLYKKEEIDKFRIEDLTNTLWIVDVKKINHTPDQVPSLMFSIFVGNSSNSAFVSIDDMESGKKEIVSEIEIPNEKWGPGNQKIVISIANKKAKLSLWTKTAGLPIIREYNSTGLISKDK